MHVLIRETGSGKEYWDNVEKKTVLVPTGTEPPFEVTVDPPSMLQGVDLAKGKDLTAANGKIIAPPSAVDLAELDVEALRAFAKENNIAVPINMKKEETIRTHIENAVAAAVEGE